VGSVTCIELRYFLDTLLFLFLLWGIHFVDLANFRRMANETLYF
jgi:hypothetical protein